MKQTNQVSKWFDIHLEPIDNGIIVHMSGKRHFVDNIWDITTLIEKHYTKWLGIKE